MPEAPSLNPQLPMQPVNSPGAMPPTSPVSLVPPQESTVPPVPTPPPVSSPTPPSSSGFPRFGVVLALFIGLVALAIAAVAYYMGLQDNQTLHNLGTTTSPSPPTYEISPEPSFLPDVPVCSMDALECPDGSYVGRTGPNCEFICPSPSPSAPAATQTTIQIDPNILPLTE